MFCMEFILHEQILKYKLNNLHVLIFLHVVCFYFACYSSIFVGAVGRWVITILCEFIAEDSVISGGGGGGEGEGVFANT